MSWFKDLPTRVKLFAGFALVIIFMAVIIGAAIKSVTAIEEARDEIFHHEFANTADILTLESRIDASRVALLTMMTTESRAARDAERARIKEATSEVDALFKVLYERNRNEPEITRLLGELDTDFTEFSDARDRRMMPLIYAGKNRQAVELASGEQAERYRRMSSTISRLEDIMKELSVGHIRVSAEESRRYINLVMLLGAAALVVSALVAIYLNRIIAAPLKSISEAASRVSSGDLTVSFDGAGRKDEVGVLADTFGRMIERLRAQTRDLSDAIGVIATSSNEIAATASELAAGAEQTAIAVSETTTTVEEVKQTSQVSSQKARHVSEIAQNAVNVSQNGTKLVRETLDGINNIKEQVEYIAGTIIKLSEHNQAIGEIIAAVDDLAEQSNLLAVNASIEASKAGEHGKGFMIVAQEIKSMSELSKQATRQVRAILNDIQKSSTAAVLATERGSKAVEATVRQSAGTGEAIHALSGAMGDASEAVIQIAASSQQQLIGMDQVVVAMNNIKQATTQNATSTKQVELTIRNLQELGGRLRDMVRHYRM